MRNGALMSVNDSIKPSLADNSDEQNNVEPEVQTDVGASSEVAAAPPERRGRIRAIWESNRFWNFLSVICVILIISVMVPLPYYKLSPGSVYATSSRIYAPKDLVYPPEGDIAFLTLNQRDDINVWEYLGALADDSIDLKHEDIIRGGRSAKEKQELDQRRMQISKNTAVVVALNRLGYELEVTPLGVEVAGVFDCTAADGTLNTGDVLRSLDGVEFLQSSELVELLKAKKVGDEVTFSVERIDPSNSARSLKVEDVVIKLGSADAECLPVEIRAAEPRPFLGITLHTLVDEQFPIDVRIDSGRVGGPSAGLAFSLALLDLLSEGEMTNGVKIAATGTIDRAGNIGPVGGVKQKAISAQRAGVDLMLVPTCCQNWADPVTGAPLDLPSNYEEAIAAAGGGDMKIVGVSTLDDALRAIDEVGGNATEFISKDTN